MGKTTIRKYIKTYISRLKNDVKPEKVILYGSFLTSRFKEGSDIDLLIVSNTFKNLDDDERLSILYRKTVGLPIDFHLYGFAPEELKTISPLTTLYEALKKGKEILSK